MRADGTLRTSVYQGTQSQSFNLIHQGGDGSTGIRNKYHDRVLNLSRSGQATAVFYNGTAGQSFTILDQPDGSKRIRNPYHDLFVALYPDGRVIGEAENHSPYQRLTLVCQGDGSQGIRVLP
ncbi:hypothetical protein [Streptomyces hundungensis]|nr:hypothetical protein [Streptomyces hundungensis]